MQKLKKLNTKTTFNYPFSTFNYSSYLCKAIQGNGKLTPSFSFLLLIERTIVTIVTIGTIATIATIATIRKKKKKE